MSDRMRVFSKPTKNTYASDYINNLRSKVKFAGTSNLAKTVALQGGILPLKTVSGHLKPYQGTYGFSSTTGSPNLSYCLNTSRSYRDLLDITKGKYLLTPPNPTQQQITLNQMEPSELYNGVFFQKSYVGTAEQMYNPSPASYLNNTILYDTDTSFNQLIYVDPSYTLFYDGKQCKSDEYFNHIEINSDLGVNGKRYLDRKLNLNLLNGFSYPSKFSLDYDQADCINANNDLQPT